MIITPLKDAREKKKGEKYRSQKGKLSKKEAEKMLANVKSSGKEWP